jgi:hypothetical protein
MNINRKVMSIIIALAITGLPVFGGDDNALAKSSAKGSGIEGTWVVTVNLLNPPTGFPASFTALETYSSGGGLVTTNPLPPAPRPGQGQWDKVRGREYKVAIQFFLFDQAGTHAGSIKVTHNIELVSKDQYTGIGQADFFDLGGNLLASVPFTSQGERLQVE